MAKREKLLGKNYDELTPKQKQELEEIHEAQQTLQERTQQLLDKMDRLGKECAEKDPAAAKELQGAVTRPTRITSPAR